MRVLAVGNMYPPHHLGGYELAWSSAMSYLREHGHLARVLTTDFRTETRAGEEPDVFRELRWYWSDHEWPPISWRGRIALERSNAAVLARHLEEFKPDVVTWWAMGGMSLSLIERVRRAGVPSVAFVHDDWLSYGPEVDRWIRSFRRVPLLAGLAERLTGLPARVELGTATRHVFVSRSVLANAQATGSGIETAAVVSSGIDPAFLDPRPERSWAWRLLYVGRLDERKGVLDALESLAQLPGEASLALAGTGDHRVAARLRDHASALGIADRVHELGMVSRAELPDIYASADVVIFPVRWQEPWGLVPLEAMGLGRPVIATGRGGSGEYLEHEINALLVAPGQPPAIATAVRRLAADPALRARLRTGGIATARGHTAALFNQRVLETLLAVAAPGAQDT